MRVFRIFLCSFVLTTVCGCGGSGSSSGGKGSTSPALNGNWEFLADSQVAGTTYLVGGNLSTAGSAVTGILHLPTSSCYINGNVLDDVPVTGTVSSSGNLSMSSTAVASQTLQFSGVWSNGAVSSGTYTITGGCANGDHGTVTGFPVPSFDGSYRGTIASAGYKIQTTISLSQSSVADKDGLFSLTGTASFSGSPCFSSGTITSSLVVGGWVQVVITTNNDGVVLFQGAITDSTGNTISGQYLVTGGKCEGNSATGTLTRS